MPPSPLTRFEATARLLFAAAEIRSLGVRRLLLFGSMLRNEARPDSDVDLLVEFKPGEKTYDRFIALVDLLEALLGHRIEVVTTESLSPFTGPCILSEAVDVLSPHPPSGFRGSLRGMSTALEREDDRI